MYITYGGYPMYIKEGVPDVHQGGGYPMYIFVTGPLGR